MAIFTVGNFSQDITGFDPSSDQLDFGNISVHSLILGNDVDGTATIVYPWQPNSFQRIEGVRWSDLSPANFADVGNEHLRGDIGGVYSWENKLGPAFDAGGNVIAGDTVYIRSHEKNIGETVVDGFDPITDKISFLYFGTRERLLVENDGPDMVISSEPIGQTFRFTNVQREDLIGQNIEFHFDQIVEDLLDRAFSFTPEQLTLVSREGLFTPEGGPTDGFQERLGQFVRNDGTIPGVAQTEEESAELLMTVGNMPAGMMMNSESVTGVPGGDGFQQAMQNVMMSMGPTQNGIELDIEGTTWSGGGFGADLILKNPSNESLTDWRVSFVAKANSFQGWGGDFQTEDLGNGLTQVTLTPKAWNATIPADGEIRVNFNAQSTDTTAGDVAITPANFFNETSSSMTMSGMNMGGMTMPGMEQGEMNMPGMEQVEMNMPVIGSASDPITGMMMNPSQNGIELDIEGMTWSGGGFGADLILANTTNSDIEDWSVSFAANANNFQGWGGDFQTEDLGNGTTQVTLTPKSWTSMIPADGEIRVNFNAVSSDIIASGVEITDDNFFV